MSARAWLWLVVVLGVLGRLVLVAVSGGLDFDLESMALVETALRRDPLDAYSTGRWPYPPGYFPALVPAGLLADLTSVSLSRVVRLPVVLADLLVAALVYRHLRARTDERRAVAAVALVMLGPSFALVSGHHGQIDAVAILPAALAFVIWQGREDSSVRTAMVVGLLIGYGAAIKTVPIVLLLALLPTARTLREAMALAVPAVALPLLLLLPFLFAHPEEASVVFRYRGFPGQGGLSLLAQPALADAWNTGAAVTPNAMTRALLDLGWVVTAAGLAITGLRLMKLRPDALSGAIVVWLAAYVFGVNFFVQYAVWIVPFLLLADRLRAALTVQLVLLAPTVIAYTRPHEDHLVSVLYSVVMVLALLAAAVWYLRLMRRRCIPSPGCGS